MIPYIKKLLKLSKIKRFIRLFFKDASLVHKKKFHKGLRILDKKFHSNFFGELNKYETRSCVVCGKRNWKPLLINPGGFKFLRCINCEMVMMNPIPSPSYLDKLYNSPEMEINLSGSPINEGLIATGGEDLEFITKHIREGKLLDIGTGGGGFLINAGKIFKAEGLDINEKHVEKGNEYGLKIHKGYSSNFNPSTKYDVITMLQVIEHLPDPMSVINDAKRLVNDKGYLYVACPNYSSKSMKLFKERHRHLSTFGHINLYSPETLTQQVEQCGFKLVHLETYRTDIELHDLFYYYLKNKKFSHRMANYNPFMRQLSETLARPFKKIFERPIKNNEGSYIRAVFKNQ